MNWLERLQDEYDELKEKIAKLKTRLDAPGILSEMNYEEYLRLYRQLEVMRQYLHILTDRLDANGG